MEFDNPTDGKPGLDWAPRQIMIGTLIVVSVALVFAFLFRFQLVLFSLFEAIVFSTAIGPLVDWIQKKGASRQMGVAIVYMLMLGLIIGSALLLIPLFAEQGTKVFFTLQGYYTDLRDTLVSSNSIILQRLAVQLPGALSVEDTVPAPFDQTLVQFTQAATMINSIFKGLFTTIAVLLLTSYWILEREKIVHAFFLIIPVERRPAIREMFSETGDRVGAYLRGLAVLSLVVGSLATLAYVIIGLPDALLLGIIAGIMEAVPLIGPILGAIPALVITLAVDPTKIVWILVATVIIQVAENNLLVPRVMDRAVGVNPVVSLLAFAAFSSLFGLAGALLAIPLAVIIQLILNRFILAPPALSTPAPIGRDSVSFIRLQAQELIQDVRKQVREKESVVDQSSDQIEDAIEAIVNDLDSILAQVETNPEGNNS